jgi:formylglycine-generating enzyme required for sulfatase activity
MMKELKIGEKVFLLQWIHPPGICVHGEIKIGDGFWIGTTPVTQALWKEVMGTDPSYFKGDGHPVEQISWNDCQEFLKGLSEKAPGGWRLPTEAEWEYAFKAGGDGSVTVLDDYAWYWKNSQNMTHPVGEKRANAWGLHDMLGNVWEWCEDRYKDSSKRIIRGGSWRSHARYVRAASRRWIVPDDRLDFLGFRLVLGT